jgi:hypothetical protein
MITFGPKRLRRNRGIEDRPLGAGGRGARLKLSAMFWRSSDGETKRTGSAEILDAGFVLGSPRRTLD